MPVTLKLLSAVPPTQIDAKQMQRRHGKRHFHKKRACRFPGTYQENSGSVRLPTMSDSSGSDDASWKNNKAAFERYGILNVDLPLDR